MTHHKSFLTPLRSNTRLWNEICVVIADLLQANNDSFLPHVNYGLVSNEILCKFVKGKADVFLAGTRFLSTFESSDRSSETEEVVQGLNPFRDIFCFDKNGKHEPKRRSIFLNCPLVWDTGASFGLTLFRADFMDYAECSIPVNNIARTNMVVGIGTTLHKFECQ